VFTFFLIIIRLIILFRHILFFVSN